MVATPIWVYNNCIRTYYFHISYINPLIDSNYIGAIIRPEKAFNWKHTNAQLNTFKYSVIYCKKRFWKNLLQPNLIAIIQKMSEKQTIIVIHKEPASSIH